ncbi:Ribonuclease H domain [Sesbania bispinosa]|nr:Ribonuclease H domain [Sesbania bispinosa]
MTDIITQVPTSSSRVWREIHRALLDLKNGFSWKLGVGEVSLWFYPWLNNTPLCNQQWCWRNAKVIGGDNRDISSAIQKISHLILDWQYLLGDDVTIQSRPKEIVWNPPPDGFIKFNADGSCCSTNSHLGIGGVARDSRADWVFGISGNVGVGSILKAELLAIYYGLSSLWDRGFRRVVCESDSLEAVKFITHHRISPFHRYDGILAKILNLLRKDWVVQINHIYREANFGADLLAKMGVDQVDVLRFWDSPLAAASLILLSDRSGTVHIESVIHAMAKKSPSNFL